ncbi:MAG: PIG-L family deacetylase [Chitinophagaceae bacterium]|nr:PIG-L family deacetylase [Chitinophagaceae bacterium]
MSNLAHSSPSNASPGNVVCVGGHPDDPESGCGGTLALLARAGYNVTIIYLTTGEAGIQGKSHSEAAAIRKQEALNACKIIKAKPVFAGQIDGATIVNNEWIDTLSKLIESEKPSMVFTHWPIDSHRDHQAAANLAIQAWFRSNQKYPLYFFEVSYGIQTTGFTPTDFCDISSTQAQKREALFCHTSQDPADIYDIVHADMEKFRGRALGVKAAEAFVRIQDNSTLFNGLLPK